MTEPRVIHSFPALESTSSELIIMKLVGVGLTVVSVLAGYGVGALATLGSGTVPPTWVVALVAVAVMSCFFAVRIRGTIRNEALLKTVRQYICESVQGDIVINETELLRAIEGETVTVSNGETVTVERDGGTMSLLVHGHDRTTTTHHM